LKGRSTTRTTKEIAIKTEKAEQAQTAWMNVVHQLRTERSPFATAYEQWQTAMAGTLRPWPWWFPSQQDITDSNIAHFCRRVGLDSYSALYDWSIHDRREFWSAVVEQLGIQFVRKPDITLNLEHGVASPRWLEGASWNIVDSCFGPDDDAAAVICADQSGALKTVTVSELRKDMLRVAASLRSARFEPGDAIAIMMPMNYESVMIYLGILAAGCVAVSIADSFAANEIRKRLQIADAKAIICQRRFLRAGKTVDIWSRVLDAAPAKAIVVEDEEGEGGEGEGGEGGLRDGDLTWARFLADGALEESNVGVFHHGSMEPINILFSSGTTGDPKAIPWNQTTPIKCAADGFFHHDIHAGDVICWPTNLGWMMGPWLIFATLINRATIALYDDAPTGEPFGRFVQRARVTMLGVVPTLVRSWRDSGCMEDCDWSAIRCLSSTGEASNPEDMSYLSWLSGCKPIIEYCGGTEIGGGYVSSTVVQPNVAGAFSTPTVGSQFLIAAPREEAGRFTGPIVESSEGPLLLIPPTMGLSTALLNRDHQATYFDGLPSGPQGETLRRHGDTFRRQRGDFGEFLFAGGRVDDTMNLGGIKTSSAEIEKVLRSVKTVSETAAIAVPAQDAGPDQLVVFAVLANDGTSSATEELKVSMNRAIRNELNPLFKVADVVITDALPRTASNKVMRRKLRDQYRRNLLSSQDRSA
jgi:acetyl-CoA synthetase